MIHMTPPPAAYVPPAVPEIRLAPIQNTQASIMESVVLGESHWAPPTRAQLMATAPVFHRSEFHQQKVSAESVKATVLEILGSQQDGDAPLTDVEGRGLSFETSAGLAQRLRDAGFHARMVQVDQEAVGNRISTYDGDSVSRPAHGLVVVEGGSEPIYVDGAVRQWFADPEARRNALPSVFVGTAEGYRQQMSQFPEELRLFENDPHTGNYHPGEFAAYLLGEAGGRTFLE